MSGSPVGSLSGDKATPIANGHGNANALAAKRLEAAAAKTASPQQSSTQASSGHANKPIVRTQKTSGAPSSSNRVVGTTVDPKTGRTSVVVDTTLSWTGGDEKAPIVHPFQNDILKDLGFKDKDVHFTGVTALETHSTAKPQLQVLVGGVAKSLVGTSDDVIGGRRDIENKPYTLNLHSGSTLKPKQVYSNEIDATYVDAGHAAVDVNAMRKAVQAQPGSTFVQVHHADNKDLYALIEANKNTLLKEVYAGKTRDGKPYFELPSSQVDEAIATYDQRVQSNFSRVDPKKVYVTLKPKDNQTSHFGKAIANASVTETEREINSSDATRHTASIEWQFDLVHPDGVPGAADAADKAQSTGALDKSSSGGAAK